MGIANKPSLKYERMLWEQGVRFVFGIDEAGRGCLAGPVHAAVAAWSVDMSPEDMHPVVRDSKQMTADNREAVFADLELKTLVHGVGFATAAEIDRWNILKCTYLSVARAMEKALAKMLAAGLCDGKNFSSFAFLSDGNHPLLTNAKFFLHQPATKDEFPLLQFLFASPIKEICLIGGDALAYSISSASILAKVTRDRVMLELDKEYPHYGFAGHKGYSTAKHMESLRTVGPCIEHRKSYAPVAEAAALFSQTTLL